MTQKALESYQHRMAGCLRLSSTKIYLVFIMYEEDVKISVNLIL